MSFWRLIILMVAICAGPLVSALSLADIPREAARPDFVIFPAHQEAALKPGESVTKQLSVINRLGRTATFSLSVEDVAPTDNTDNPVALLGEERGAYSLKNYIFLERSTVTLDPGGDVTVPITISLPENAPPGGLYGAVAVTAISGDATSNARVATKAASLFFVKIDGTVEEKAELLSFGLTRKFAQFTTKPLTFHLSFSNEGNIYLNPYGGIKVKNLFGRTIWVKPIDPWFVLPDTTRLREFTWTPGYAFGIYRATVELNRGYGDSIDRETIWLVRAPWPILIGIVLILGALFLRYRVVQSRQ